MLLLFAPRDSSMENLGPGWLPATVGGMVLLTAPISMGTFMDNSVRPHKIFSSIKRDLKDARKLHVASSKFRSSEELWHFLDSQDIKLYLFGLAVDENLKGKVRVCWTSTYNGKERKTKVVREDRSDDAVYTPETRFARLQHRSNVINTSS